MTNKIYSGYSNQINNQINNQSAKLGSIQWLTDDITLGVMGIAHRARGGQLTPKYTLPYPHI
jgi:hypothetical protein